MKSLYHKLHRLRAKGCSMVVAAGGSSQRMGGVNKLTMDLCGVPVLRRTLAALQSAELVDEIVIACRADELEQFSAWVREWKIDKCKKIVEGGTDRLHSVYAAVCACDEKAAFIGVHDAARPLVTPDLVSRCIFAARTHGAVAPAVALTDTIRQVDEKGFVCATIDRSTLRAMQTPQVFDADFLKAALKNAVDRGLALTDDCAAVEAIGKAVTLIEGERENIKLTTPLDLIVAEAILDKRRQEAEKA